ncbi:MAG: response regulator, partial [Planctomycetota bacterium]
STATDGQEALQALTDETFALAILDIMMPALSGYDVLDRLRTGDDRLPCPVVFLTAKGMDGDRERAEASGVQAYISKPFSPQEITRLARRIIGKDGA